MKYLVTGYNGTVVEEIDGLIELNGDTIKFYKNENGIVKIVAIFNSRHVFIIK
jgi:hypothetical protein